MSKNISSQGLKRREFISSALALVGCGRCCEYVGELECVGGWRRYQIPRPDRPLHSFWHNRCLVGRLAQWQPSHVNRHAADHRRHGALRVARHRALLRTSRTVFGQPARAQANVRCGGHSINRRWRFAARARVEASFEPKFPGESPQSMDQRGGQCRAHRRHGELRARFSGALWLRPLEDQYGQPARKVDQATINSRHWPTP